MDNKPTKSRAQAQKPPAAETKQGLTAPERLQHSAAHIDDSTMLVSARIIIDDLHYSDELLPAEVVRGLLNPNVGDFFIRIKGLQQIPRSKGHYLHTSYIREVILFDELPDGA